MHNIYSGNDNTPPPVDNNANGVSASVKAGMQSASSAASSLLSSINGAVEKLQIKASGAPPVSKDILHPNRVQLYCGVANQLKTSVIL